MTNPKIAEMAAQLTGAKELRICGGEVDIAEVVERLERNQVLQQCLRRRIRVQVYRRRQDIVPEIYIPHLVQHKLLLAIDRAGIRAHLRRRRAFIAGAGGGRKDSHQGECSCAVHLRIIRSGLLHSRDRPQVLAHHPVFDKTSGSTRKGFASLSNPAQCSAIVRPVEGCTSPGAMSASGPSTKP